MWVVRGKEKTNTMERGWAQSRSYIHGMKIISVNQELVEVLWIDDNEIEYIPMSEFISKYGQAKLNQFINQ
jgi:hypothetical protein